MVAMIRQLNLLIFLAMVVFYSYQLIYVLIALVKKDKGAGKAAKEEHRFAAIIAARNESAVIGNLIDSLKNQNYPQELLDVYVIADNCTDDTAGTARAHGAIVYERFNLDEVGKSYALDYAFGNIDRDSGIRHYDGYFIFDADNVLEHDYVKEMNRTFDRGYRVVTSYRNSKNYGSNWISAGYALWFLRESRFLNEARMLCHTSCAVSGTGFLVSSTIIEENGGWKHHLLTEDIQFSVDNAIKGEVIGYCGRAVLYDEQPERMKESWRQRMRWCKGFYQVFARYGAKLFKGAVVERRFQCYDMLMTITPATVLTLFSIIMNFVFLGVGHYYGRPAIVNIAVLEIWYCVSGVYCSLLFFGVVTTITEWDKIYCPTHKKILYLFSFPVFILTYIPISIVALLKPVKWEPIHHTVSKSLQEIRS